MTRRANGSNPIALMREEMSRLFGDLLETGAAPFVAAVGTFPAFNVWENEESLFAEAELPGVKMDDLEVHVTGNELSIKGQRRDEQPSTGRYHRRERTIGSFNRVIRFPIDVDSNRVVAELKDGVLTVTLPKSAQSRPRKIEVIAAKQ